MKDKQKAITKAQAKLQKLEAKEAKMQSDYASRLKAAQEEILKVKGQLFDLTRTEKV